MPRRVDFDDCLSLRDGHLFMEEADTTELVRQFGSPLFVYSENQLCRNVRRFRAAFQAGWPEGTVKVMPAAKANWLPAIQRILVREGCGCDVYSPGELSIALAAGCNPEFISVNGFPKEPAHIRTCIEQGVRITIDSLEEVPIIDEVAATLGRIARVRLRIKAPLSGFIHHSEFVAEGLVPTDLAALVYKNGLTFEDIVEIGPRLANSKNIEIVGFHQHNGRHRATTAYWEEQMRVYAKEIGRVCRLLGGLQPKEIDIGGGFAIPRDPFNAATHYSEPAQLAVLHVFSKLLRPLGARVRYAILGLLVDRIAGKPKEERAPTIESYAGACTRALRAGLAKEGIDTRGIMLQLEPGRSMHGNAGIHLATVKSIKHVRRPIRWTVIAVDTTEFWFTGGRYEHHLHHYVFANKGNEPMTGRADIVGRSCYGDRLLPAVRIPDVEVGDILAFLDTGAYQEVSASNFNAMLRPPTVLVTGSDAFVIRRRETEDDLMRRDSMPSHLAKQPSAASQDFVEEEGKD
jgi:diaminopimelate decarboxylase